MTYPHPAAIDPDELYAECSLKQTRGTGPGGQHRNKVATAVILTHDPTGITGQASERREQIANRKVALFRLRVNLALQVRRTPAYPPSDLIQARFLKGSIKVNPTHTDFPAILAEVLDNLYDCQLDPRQAGSRLGCSTSQLVKFLKNEPRALQQINTKRAEKKLHPLR
ncbi:MAG TPA: peptide chain release factor-like protein [Phycisphaerales bacterium]|nr:peptide chain release factor-like protein [Phycisphaerales bacterium]HCD34548.1 peptide chain release factor-like protein [Phycisphaerales bacterium]|tara:strand:+ start:457 stop:960 length:504 start_codon:yes stop_codon:yes gene_type:complete